MGITQRAITFHFLSINPEFFSQDSNGVMPLSVG